MKKVLKPEIKFGAEPKKLAVLGGLLAVLVVVWLMNSGDSGAPPPVSTTTPRPAVRPAAPAGARPPVRADIRRAGRTTTGTRDLSVQEFRPTLKPKDPIDTSQVDPTLRLDTLSRLRGVKLEGGSRSLFEFSGAPAPAVKDLPKVAPIHPGIQTAMTTGPQKPAPPAPTPAPPPPTPIPLKFYGYTNSQRPGPGPKRAFFIEGEDIFVAGEGDTIKNRYKIIRIGVNSAVVEDTSNKNQQTLPLVQEMANT